MDAARGPSFAADQDEGPHRGSGRRMPPLVSEIEAATTNAGARAEGGLTPDFLALSICGSDIRAIYREHLGKGPEGYQNKIAGHEPCGQIVAEGPVLKRFKKGDRVIVYHISECGMCYGCRRGYMISCTSSFRAAYGWQRDGGMASYILAEDKGRLTAIQATRKWGKITLVGEGGTLGLSPSPDLIHDQKTVYGSWVTSIWLMEDLVERIVRWKIHPEDLVTNRFPLEKANEAYALMATGKSGKVAVVFDEELK